LSTPQSSLLALNRSRWRRALLDLIRTDAGDLDWTYISLAARMEPGERTGTYRWGGDQLLADRDGNSAISAEDYALALVV
jgi:uncharacterized protein